MTEDVRHEMQMVSEDVRAITQDLRSAHGQIDSDAQHLLGEVFADLGRDADAVVADLADLQFAMNS